MTTKKGAGEPSAPATAPINPDPPGRGFRFSGQLSDAARSQFLTGLLWLKLDLATIHQHDNGISKLMFRLAADAPFHDVQAYFSIVAALKPLGTLEEI